MKIMIFQKKNIQRQEWYCSTFLQISLVSVLVEAAGFPYLLLHSVCHNMFLWLKYMKKICPHTDMCLDKGDLMACLTGPWGPSEVFRPHYNNCCFKILSQMLYYTFIIFVHIIKWKYSFYVCVVLMSTFDFSFMYYGRLFS